MLSMIPSTVPDVPSIPNVGMGVFSTVFQWISTISTIAQNLYSHFTDGLSTFISLVQRGFSFLSSVVSIMPTAYQTFALAFLSVSIIYVVIKR